jgi:superfamily II DNA or RNA helicase
MSILVRLSTLNPEALAKIDKDLNLTICTKPSGYGQKTAQNTYVQAYRIQQSSLLFLPFAYAVQQGFTPMTHRPLTRPFRFTGTLREEQKVVRNEVLEILNRQHSAILSTHVGFGKSILAVYFAYKIQLKTLIIVNRLVLMQQWEGVLQQFIDNPKVQVIKPNKLIDWDNDFFIVNAINLPKLGYMPEIGLVLVDEVHLIVSKVLSTSFQYVTPQYLIGLSATPYRNDGMDILLDLYFGQARVDRQLQRVHHVYRVDTKFTPTVEKQANGKVDWNHILNQQANDSARNDLVVEIIQSNTLNFLVLCKRVDQIKLLESKLKEKGIEPECLYGDKQPSGTPPTNNQKMVMIGTIQKVGTGYDNPYLNAMIVASDLEAYFIQYLGRIFRKQDTIPVVFDLVDDNSILKKHYKTREKAYLKHGGIVKKTPKPSKPTQQKH